jgi:hypothetical protein
LRGIGLNLDGAAKINTPAISVLVGGFLSDMRDLRNLPQWRRGLLAAAWFAITAFVVGTILFAVFRTLAG